MAQWLGKLWVYPYWSLPVYAATFVLGFCAYWLLIAETYLAARAILRRFVPSPAGLADARPAAGGGFRTGGVVGATMMLTGVLAAAHAYRAEGGYVFDVAAPTRSVGPTARP